ncbi:cell filamentation protein Fic [candidate division WWE3 bacterium CG_4_10_14_0_2_um_filter_41_14]|uniref:Cell filamentation protein Fic n=1 Tax=candidate division WWE3 bacterium CG_4_10_14_0_2_um_filter_41_14 TaxID=1975072 RepID=A0A2M7TIR5_UNCKA|nr:MAG: cell filamentation protein Fic [candidate division WWE3 bacterium CG_4_10_14_0_2_um_filter_41_14]
MNETITTSRQKYILNIINQSEGINRKDIQNKTATLYPVSKPTLIRDLNVLIKQKLIIAKGSAKSTTYFSKTASPLLREFDLERYFAEGPDTRTQGAVPYDFGVIEQFRDLFTKHELLLLTNNTSNFSQKTAYLAPEMLKKELERFVIELSWKSSHIEGNTYTLLETESLILQQKEAAGKSNHETTMILNHKKAFSEILNMANEFRSLSTAHVITIHSLLTRGLQIARGLRSQPVGITGTTYEPLDNKHQITDALEKMVVCINNTNNPFEKALIAHFMIAYIQPFTDGNKRTARMVTNAILLAHDLLPLSYRSVDEDLFKKALILFYEQHSIVDIKKLFIEQVLFANKTYFR